ncbi:hypothetical protein, partial [Phocaeicola plebeius]|jgi:hypothetical protein
MELHRFFRYAIEKMCKEKKSLNHFDYKNTKFISLNLKGFIYLPPNRQIQATPQNLKEFINLNSNKNRHP